MQNFPWNDPWAAGWEVASPGLLSVRELSLGSRTHVWGLPWSLG